MKILVTGGAGYIGCHAVRELLDHGHEVTILDNLHMGKGIGLMPVCGRPNVRIIIGDIRNKNDVEKAVEGQDKVIHLAAIVGEPACDRNEKLAKEVNVDGSINVLSACKKFKVKHLHAMSTASSYGVQDDSVLATEETPTNPISFYAETKLSMEEKLLDAADKDFYVTFFRPSTVHGISTRMRFDLIVNTMTKLCFTKGELNLFGLTLWRPIFWVGDAGRALRIIVEADPGIVRNKIYNCGNNSENYKIKEIGERVASHFDNVKINYDSSIKDARSYKVDFSKFERDTGFKVTRSVDQCVEDMKLALETGIISDPEDPRYYNHRYED